MPGLHRIMLSIILFAAAAAAFIFACPENCKPRAAPLNAIGKFSELIGEGETHNIFLFSADFRRDSTAYVQEREDAEVRVAIPKWKAIDFGRIYEISAQEAAPKIRLSGISGIMYSTVYKLYYADAVEEYDEIMLNYAGFYNYCWDYDCASESLPFPKMEKPLKRLFLSGESSGAFFKGVKAGRSLPPRGNVSIAFVFLYDAAPVPEARLSSLKGVTNTTKAESFAYVPAWYNEKADEIAHKNNLINMSIAFFEPQLKVPSGLLLSSYSSCTNTDFSEFIFTQLPETRRYDILVQFYYAGRESSNILCSPHPIGRNSIFLYATPDSISSSYSQNLIVSLAHELAHLFGATDKYTGSGEVEKLGGGCSVESENPEELGKDIMCHRVPEYRNGSFAGFINPSLNELLINGITAKEMGWYDLDRDGAIDVEDLCPLDSLNACIIPLQK